MQATSIILAVACFSAKTFAQGYEADASSFLSDPEVSSELAQLPSSVASQLASSVPKLEGDIDNYVSSLIRGPPFTAVASKLNPLLPDDAKSQLASDPSGFVYNVITAETPPAWASAIPTDVLPYFISVGNDVDSIIDNGVTIPPVPLPTPRTTLGPRPGSSGTTIVSITRPTVVATSPPSVVTTSPSSTVTRVPAGSGVLPSGGLASAGTGNGFSSGSGNGRVVTPTSPSPSSFVPNSASRWNSMTGAGVALIAVGVGALLLA